MAISDRLLAEQTREDRLRVQALVDTGMSASKALREVFPDDSNRSRRLQTWKNRGLFPVPQSERETGTTAMDTPGTTGLESVTPSPCVPGQEIIEPELPETGDTETTQELVTDTTGLGVIPADVSPDDQIQHPEAPESGTTDQTLPDTTTFNSTSPQVITETSATDLLDLIDQRVETRLKSLVSAFEQPEKRTNVGGRGHQGRTHVKINISIPAELNEALDGITATSGGTKSAHIAAALRLYLEISNQ